MSVYVPSKSDDMDPPKKAKATLFCPACGHESTPWGDWVVHVHETRAVYKCPDCETRVARRGRTPKTPPTESGHPEY